jgi:predicted ATPase
MLLQRERLQRQALDALRRLIDVCQAGGELERACRAARRQALARELGVEPSNDMVDAGGHRLSRYRFRHILLQQHAYNRLDEAERAYLHEAVGDALEQLYAGQPESIAVQLARHFYAAAHMDKAAGYSLLAGDWARGLYAYTEARQHYARAVWSRRVP